MTADTDTSSRESTVRVKEDCDKTLLQVLICTYGEEGIKRVAEGKHPEMRGVEYLVSWQTSGDTRLPSDLEREDFRIYRTPTKGLSVNRNHALSKATAPLLLISDDDVDYTREMLQDVINAFRDNPDCDLLTFRYESRKGNKLYPTESFSLDRPLKGYYLSSIELAFRRVAVQRKIWFNENFGIGALFPAGEEDIFLFDCLATGLRGKYIPVTIVRHDPDTTSARIRMLPQYAEAKGAVFLHTHPHDWRLRMIIHAVREISLWRKGKALSPVSYMRNWLKGTATARKESVFPTPDYSNKYPCV